MKKRRFTTDELINILHNNGFATIKYSYIYFSIFPLVLLKRILIDKFINSNESDVFPIPKIINSLFIFLLKLESFLLNNIKLPIGSSIIILAVKK